MPVSQLGFPDVPRSITNSNVKNSNAIDALDPMSFLTFIKSITTSLQPDTLQKYYTEYLSRWNIKRGKNEIDNKRTIIERYRDFIKEISLDYTTNEEKKFLTKLDFNDPLDIDISIPFFSKKLIQISNYYNEKREDSKFEIFRNKTRGTNFGIRREILELSLNYLSNIQDKDLKFNYNEIKNKIEVEIEELYDYYPSYFNQDPDVLIYDNKDLDYGLDIFLKEDQSIISEVFGGLTPELINLKEIDKLLENKRKLTKSYVSSNFYFLSTGNTVTDFVSGEAFGVDDPVSNFLNRDFPTTASTERESFKTSSEVGFFKPQKTSIVLVDGERNSFRFNFENIEPKSIYYFPDPNILGLNGDVLTFIVNDEGLRMGGSCGIAKNLPTSKKIDAKFYGYTSTIELDEHKYLDKIFESGYIQDSKYDIYGNLYGLFKNGNNFKQSISSVDDKIIKSLLLNGHKFYDDTFGEGSLFEYDTEDYATFETIKRSGITTKTNGFSALSGNYTLFGRFFVPYQELSYSSSVSTTYHFYDGGYLLDGETPYIDTISSDLGEYPNNGIFYYTTLLEGGINETAPIQRALLDPLFPSLTANLLEVFRPDGVDTFNVDCKDLLTDFDWRTYNTGAYIEDVLETTQYNISSFNTDNYFSRMDLDGVIYIRNQSTKAVNNITSVLQYLSGSVTIGVFEELNSDIQNFDIVNDILFIETENYLVIFKVYFDGYNFQDPRSFVYVINKNINPFNLVTNRYKIKNNVFFCVTNPHNDPTVTGEFDLLLYKINLITFKISKTDYSVSFNEQMDTAINIGTPCLSYNSRPNIMAVSFLVKDVNNLFDINEIDFDATDYSILRYNRFIK